MDARLWLSAAAEPPRSFALSRERTVIGRSPEADLQLDDEAVSWNHLEIERRGEVLMASDLDSRNGTALNGEPLDRPRRLRDGDTLIVGGVRLELKTGGSVTPVGATVASSEPGVALNEEERATGRRPRRPLPQRGRLRRPSRDQGRDRRGAARQRAHRPAPARRPRRQA
jgi:pSer/pThr/pTyr-binding forkhead associated (FHA) protein